MSRICCGGSRRSLLGWAGSGCGADPVDGADGRCRHQAHLSGDAWAARSSSGGQLCGPPPMARPRTSYFYSTPKKMVITVQVYRRRPARAERAATIRRWSTSSPTNSRSIEQQVSGGGYANFERPAVPSTCTYGACTFRCITYSAVSQANMRVYSKLLLTGYQRALHQDPHRLGARAPAGSRPAPMPSSPAGLHPGACSH